VTALRLGRRVRLRTLEPLADLHLGWGLLISGITNPQIDVRPLSRSRFSALSLRANEKRLEKLTPVA
jgi:hypothetical protein